MTELEFEELVAKLQQRMETAWASLILGGTLGFLIGVVTTCVVMWYSKFIGGYYGK